jgi:CDP-glycerol glycerophosphotransferase
MVASATLSGSDIVSGVAERFDSSGTWKADQYRAPFDTDRLSTHMFRDPLLVYDQMACSKLFRRSFWETEGLEFPTGSLYEDVEVVMKAHCRASSVDLIAETTYCWRRREAGGLSITQDRFRRGSTSARFQALWRADALLRTEAPANVWTEHGVKVLSVDIRLYSRLLEGSSAEFIDEFMTSAGNLASSISPDAVLRVNPVVRRLHSYLISGNVDGVIACTRLFSGSDRRSLGRLASGAAWLARHDVRSLAGIATETMATALGKLGRRRC